MTREHAMAVTGPLTLFQLHKGFTNPKVLIDDPTHNTQAELWGPITSRRAAVSFSLWLDSIDSSNSRELL